MSPELDALLRADFERHNCEPACRVRRINKADNIRVVWHCGVNLNSFGIHYRMSFSGCDV
jgi:hypothetical protein